MIKRTNSILDFLEESARKFPDKIAFADENNAITYKEIVKKARRMAVGISEKSPPRSAVAVLGGKNIETITAFFACVYAGCFYVPLNPAHPSCRRNRILTTLNHPLVLIERGFENLLPEECEEIYFTADGGNTLFFDDAEEKDNPEILDKIRSNHIDTDPLYIMFTSGSTGTPKGIAVSHRSVIDFIGEFVNLFGINDSDVIGNQAPFDFDVSVKDIYSTIAVGAMMQIIPKKCFSFPMPLIDFLIDRKVTTLIWAVSALCIISTYRGFSYKVPADIKRVLFSGEAMPVKHLNIWKKALPETVFVNLYGPTEITCNCTYYVLPNGVFDKGILPIGKPFRNERVFLLSEKGEEITEPNVTGEICVCGTALSLGYYNCKEETEKAFVQNPVNPYYNEIIYKTGDLGYYDEIGNLCFVGRKDFQIKHMGHRIELAEIETALTSIENVDRAICLYNSHKEKIIGIYQGAAESSVVAAGLRDSLPAFMIPSHFEKIEKFPLSENGKIDRKKVKELYLK